MPHAFTRVYLKSGSASNQYVYSDRVPQGKIFKVTLASAGWWTTNPGDEETAKYMVIGVEVSGQVAPIQGKDNGTAEKCTRIEAPVYLKENDRIFAYFEAHATTVTDFLFVSGLLYDIDEVS